MIFKVTPIQASGWAKTFGQWSGYVAPNKVSQFHVDKGWHLGYRVDWAGGPIPQVRSTDAFLSHIGVPTTAKWSIELELGDGLSLWQVQKFVVYDKPRKIVYGVFNTATEAISFSDDLWDVQGVLISSFYKTGYEFVGKEIVKGAY